MKAIILAAGYATRLYPLTLDMPKALLKINNVPIINYIINEINTLEKINYIYLISNNKFAQKFYDWQDNFKIKNLKIINDGTTCEENKLGAIGDINFAINSENIHDDLLIIAGDSFFDFKLKDFYDFYTRVDSHCACAKEFKNNLNLNRYAIALIDKNNKLINLEEKPKKPKSNLVVYASYIYKRSVIKLIEKYLEQNNNPDAPGYFLQWLYKLNNVYIYKINGEFYDIGTHESYKSVQAFCKDKK